MAPDTTRYKEFINQAHIVVLATVGRNGRPYAAPFWYLYDDGVIRIHVGQNSRTRRNVDHQPAVALVIDSRQPPYYALKIRGKAEIGPQLDPETRLRLAVRYLGQKPAEEYVTKRPVKGAVTLNIRPETISEYAGTL